MYDLGLVYSKNTYDGWGKAPNIRSLKHTRTKTADANLPENVWDVSNFSDLIEGVSFLGSMNKRCGFWNSDFPQISESALMPHIDPLLDKFAKVFGRSGAESIDSTAAAL